MPSAISLGIHAAGLILIYSLYGALQEKILKRSTYGPGNEHFTSSSLLILCNRIFSISIGILILAFKSRSGVSLAAGSNSSSLAVFRARLRPTSPLIAYAAVAVFNFASTTCQYEALKYVSYTTQSLAKTAKMIPVLVVGALIYKKKNSTKEWVSGAVVLAGCAAYIFSQPPRHAKTIVPEEGADSLWSGILGTLYLLGYLFMDGLVSTTQEKVFGKNPSSSDPFGPDSPVLDQMIWTNFFASLIAIAVALLSNTTGTLLPNLRLLFTSATLVWDITVFSAASAVGLIILLNTIASFGALTSSTIMTCRQFLSILINAGLFGDFSTTSIQGWTGVGWVASGLFIKMNRTYDPPKALKSSKAALLDAVDDGEMEELHTELKEYEEAPTGVDGQKRVKQYFFQYLVPVLVPVCIGLLIAPFLEPTGKAALDSPTQTAVGETSSAINEADVRTKPKVHLEGSLWDAEIYDAVAPNCFHNETAVRWPGSTRTGFVSYPRSGNSYLRSLVERATGYQTSSIYCDKSLRQTFVGECDHSQKFFVKTHFPALPATIPPGSEDYWTRYDQVLHLVRNPLDAVASWWHLANVPKKAEGFTDHEGKVDIGKFGAEQRNQVLDLAQRWVVHTNYWQRVPIQTHFLRYEDLRMSPLPKMLSILSFLLPFEDLPSINDLACLVETDKAHEPYTSQKNRDFASWDLWEPDLRMEVLEIVRRTFCSLGYDRLLISKLGEVDEMTGFCESVVFDTTGDVLDLTRGVENKEEPKVKPKPKLMKMVKVKTAPRGA